MLRIFSSVFILIFSTFAFASSTLPANLNASDRATALGILGFGSASKLLSSPYPMGGYSGVELGFSSEYIPMADVATLGAKTNNRSDLNYFNLTVGKGLYYNIDLLVQFIPMPQDESVSGYGAQLRWGFFEASFMPATLSFVINGSSTNFNNVLGTETTGADLVGAVSMRDVSLFVGIGQARTFGTFIGGTGGVTDSGNSEGADVSSAHTVFGVSVKMSQVFLAMEVDRYVQSTYAGKLGVRF